MPDDIDLEKALGLLSLPREVGMLAGRRRADPGRRRPLWPLCQARQDLREPRRRRRRSHRRPQSRGHADRRQEGEPEKGPPLRPRSRQLLGEHPDKGGPVVVKNGRYGPYVSNNGINATITGDKTPETITLTEAVVLLDARAEALGQQPRRAAGRKKAGEAEAPKAARPRRQEGRDRSEPASRKPRKKRRRRKGRQDHRRRIALAKAVRHPYISSNSAVSAQNTHLQTKHSLKSYRITLPSKDESRLHRANRPAKSAPAKSRAPSASRTRCAPNSSACCANSPTKARVEKRRKKLHQPARCPTPCSPTSPSRDRDGDLIAAPDEWDEEAHGPAPKIRIHAPRKRARPAKLPPASATACCCASSEIDDDGRIRHRGRVIKIHRPAEAPRARHLPHAARTAAAGSSRSTRNMLGKDLTIPRAADRRRTGRRPGRGRGQHARAASACRKAQVERAARLAEEREGGQPDRHPRASIPSVFPPRHAGGSRSREAGDR